MMLRVAVTLIVICWETSLPSVENRHLLAERNEGPCSTCVTRIATTSRELDEGRLTTAGTSPEAGKRPVPEPLILGDWCAGSDNAFHEEFSLTIEEGERHFASWLHHRPAESGTWELKHRALTVRVSSGRTYVYVIESASASRLVLRDQGDSSRRSETYVREGCREFDPET